MYTKEELKALNNIAESMFGCKFEDLDWEEQDEVYCYYEENVR